MYMKNQRNILGAIVIVTLIVAVAVFWDKQMVKDNGKSELTPTPTVTTNPPATTPTPISSSNVSGYTSQRAHLKLDFTQKMNVYDYMTSNTVGWIVVSMNPIDKNDPQANGLAINYETPNIEGKGGACESWKSNSMFGQTIQYCEDQKSLSGGYLMNKAAKTEYAFFITAKGVTEKDAYKYIIFNGLSLQ